MNGRGSKAAIFVSYLRLSRIYTWTDAVLTGLLALSVAGSRPTWLALTECLLASLGLWLGLNWTSESIQSDPGRRSVPLGLGFGALLLVPCILPPAHSNSLLFFATYFVLAFIYPLKKRAPVLASVCYAIRGAQTVLQFAFIWSIFATQTSSFPWLAVAGLFLLQSCRSLTAEVRDVRFDRFGIATVVMKKARTRGLYIVLYGTVLIGFLGGLLLGGGFLSVAFIGLAVGVLSKSWPVDSKAYIEHKYYVTASALVKASACGFLSMKLTLLITMVSFIIAELEYDRVFRPINRYVRLTALRGQVKRRYVDQRKSLRPHPIS